MNFRGDIGQVNVSPYRKTVRLRAKNDPESGAHWELIIKPRWASVTLLLFNGTAPFGREVALSSYTSVVGYFLMCAICRGMSESEVSETETECVIDCGTMPPA